MKISASECAEAEAEICRGCSKEYDYEDNGVGCRISLAAEFHGAVPSEWDLSEMSCSGYESEEES